MKRILFVGLSVIALLTSCVKETKTVTGEAHVRIVNAVPGSKNQDVYINSDLVNTNLPYGAATPYRAYTSGINLLGITNTGSTIANFAYDYGSEIGEYATVYFFIDFTGALVSGGIKEDLTAPPAGKANVRFLNLDNYSQTSFTMSVLGGDSLFTSLVFTTVTPYYAVDPGTKFIATATGVTNIPVIDMNIQAGKIYTIWISAGSEKELNAYGIVQN